MVKKYDATEGKTQKNTKYHLVCVCVCVCVGLKAAILIFERSKTTRIPQTLILHLQEMSKR
jgi:hypothetical protein